jgi:hypothetical protein
MNEHANHPSDVFLRFSRRSMLATLIVVAILGGTTLTLMLAPQGAIGRASNLGWWLIPVLVAAAIAVQTSVRRRRWSGDARAVEMVMQDELRRTNMDRAFRIALIATLGLQWPLAIAVSTIAWLNGERAAMIMAASTITVGLLTLIASFLLFDRES